MLAPAHHAVLTAGTSIWDIGTAIGTVGATVIALATVLWRGWTQPRLRLHMTTGRPPNNDLTNGASLIRSRSSSGGDGPQMTNRSAWVRARVEATRQAAQGAQVVIQSAHVRVDGNDSVSLELGGMALCWSSQAVRTAELTIPRGVSRHVDIASISKREGPTPLTIETTFLPNDKRNHVEHGEVTLELALASHNGPSCRYRVVIEFDGEWPKDDAEVWKHLKVSQPERLKR